MPVAHNTPGFVSFSNYLDANAGSLEQERNAALANATAAGDKAQADLDALGPQAYDAGKAQAQADWSAVAPDGVNPPLKFQRGPSFGSPAVQGQMEGYGATDVTALPGYSQFLTDRQAAVDAATSLNDPSRAADKYSPWESGLVNASSDYQGKAAGLQSKYAFNDYLDNLTNQAKAGAASYSPPTKPRPAPPENAGSMGPGAYTDAGPNPGTSYSTPDPNASLDPNQSPVATGGPNDDDTHGAWGGGG